MKLLICIVGTVIVSIPDLIEGLSAVGAFLLLINFHKSIFW